MSINYPTLVHFRHFSSLYTNLRSTTVENSLQITPFYAKQSQSQVSQKQRKLFCDKQIRIVGHLVIQTNKAKNKPNSNPIKPKQTQFNPIQSQFKPNNQSSLITNHLEGWFHQTNILVTIPKKCVQNTISQE